MAYSPFIDARLIEAYEKRDHVDRYNGGLWRNISILNRKITLLFMLWSLLSYNILSITVATVFKAHTLLSD